MNTSLKRPKAEGGDDYIEIFKTAASHNGKNGAVQLNFHNGQASAEGTILTVINNETTT
ncbi:hypothetical protein [Alteribacillus sp. HJP-4]|uniref:hypothetical protein n=1 Tax=Alteribacillus sp. HJP-4 TaxID=2775394 RepID=UPI0035CCFD69